MTDDEKETKMLQIIALKMAQELVWEESLSLDKSQPKEELLYLTKEALRSLGAKMYPALPDGFWDADEETQAIMDKAYEKRLDELTEQDKKALTIKGELITFWAPKLVRTVEVHPDLEQWSAEDMFSRIINALIEKREELEGEIYNADIHNND